MLGDLLKGIITFIVAFILGAGYGQDKPAADSELQQKVQAHMDVIIDESAGIVDDVMEEVRQDERVQKLEDFASDVNEIAENTKADIDAHFGSDEEEAEDAQDTDAETADGAAASEETAAENVEASEDISEETVPEETTAE